jgi:hypothetical protein
MHAAVNDIAIASHAIGPGSRRQNEAVEPPARERKGPHQSIGA